MSNLTYTQLINRTLEIYSDRGTKEAYDYIMGNKDRIVGGRNDAQIYNFAYACAAASGLEKEALNLLKEAIFINGYWYSYDYLMNDDDLKSLHKYPQFQEMADLCKVREEEAHASTKPELRVIPVESKRTKSPLVIALHGDQENITITAPYWQSVVPQGYSLALPQSSQIQFSQGFEWEDVEKGSDELKVHLDNLLEQNNIDEENIIVGGISAGARVALHAILKEKIAAKGYIFMAPWLPEIEEWEPMLDVLKEKNIKGYIICGDEDGDCEECTKQFVEMLADKEIEHVFISVAELDHDYPEVFDEILEDALKYLSQ